MDVCEEIDERIQKTNKKLPASLKKTDMNASTVYSSERIKCITMSNEKLHKKASNN